MSGRKKTGFTIVELIIVIIVIAVIASIVIIAYNGVQTRAENTKTVQGVAKYVRGILLYATTNGTYPVEAAYPCLGPLGTSCARLSGTNTCTASGGDGGANAQSTFDTNIKQVISGSLPQLSKQALSCSGNTYGGGYYRPSTGTTAQIVYYLRG